MTNVLIFITACLLAMILAYGLIKAHDILSEILKVLQRIESHTWKVQDQMTSGDSDMQSKQIVLNKKVHQILTIMGGEKAYKKAVHAQGKDTTKTTSNGKEEE